MVLDFDLSTIQEARDLARQAKKAQDALANYSAQQIDAILVAMVKAVEDNAEALARQAVDKSGWTASLQRGILQQLCGSAAALDRIGMRRKNNCVA